MRAISESYFIDPHCIIIWLLSLSKYLRALVGNIYYNSFDVFPNMLYFGLEGTSFYNQNVTRDLKYTYKHIKYLNKINSSSSECEVYNNLDYNKLMQKFQFACTIANGIRYVPKFEKHNIFKNNKSWRKCSHLSDLQLLVTGHAGKEGWIWRYIVI